MGCGEGPEWTGTPWLAGGLCVPHCSSLCWRDPFLGVLFLGVEAGVEAGKGPWHQLGRQLDSVLAFGVFIF